MPKPASSFDDTASLRGRAVARWHEQQAGDATVHIDATDTPRLVHELQVHQIELEMQNTELKRAREELETTLEKITELFDFAPMGYFTLDPEGTIREVNLTGASLLGSTRFTLTNQRFALSVAMKDRRAFADFLQQVFSSKTRVSCEIALEVTDKPPLAVELEAVVCEAGRTCKVALMDLTEHNRAEADRLVLNKLESTGILAGGIAHDFNNILASIVLAIDLAQPFVSADRDVAGCLIDAKKTALLARNLAQQLITFSSGGEPQMKAAALPGLIRESARLALSGSRMQSDFFLAENLWLVTADEGQIGQVIRNIVLNAREAMPAGGTVVIRAENVTRTNHEKPALPSGNYVRVSISDQGIGISPEDLPQIFDPYFSTKERGEQKGMGLGLTVCHSIIEKHGGTIAVQSTSGQGTTVEFYLPVAAHPLHAEPAAESQVNLQPHKILVMDDEETVLAVFGKALKQMGHTVALTEHGQKAIEAYATAKNQGKPFDVVLLDLTIGEGMDGRATIAALRQIDPDVKAIVMSGFPDDPMICDFKRYGFAAALVKPFDSAKLQEALIQILSPGSVPEIPQ